MKPDSYKNEEAAIAKAVEAYQLDKTQKISVLSREYGVSYKKLQRRVQGGNSRSTRPPTNRLFTNAQEDALRAWIKCLDNIGVPPTIELLKTQANLILRNMTLIGEVPRQVGPMWAYRFVDRMPDNFKRLIQKPMDSNRVNSEDLGILQTWFDRLEIQLNTYKIKPENIYNFDETGFQIGQGKKEAVITAYKISSENIASSSIRESLTIIECANPRGDLIPPFLILAGKAHMEHWYRDLDPNWVLGVSPNGYISDELALEWIHHFNTSTLPGIEEGEYRLLLMDNCLNHTTAQFLHYCDINDIIIYAFPPHTTHLLQPLDGAPFQQYKHFHGKAVNRQARLGGRFYDKSDFLYEINKVRTEALTRRTIKAGFRDRGIWPLDPEVVLKPLQDKIDAAGEPILQIFNEEEQNIPSSPTTGSRSPPKATPDIERSIKRLRRDIGVIEDTLESASPNLKRRLNKLFEASLYKAHLSDLHEEQVKRLTELNTRKNRKKTKRQVQTGGILTVKDANRFIEARKVEEMVKRWKKQLPLGAKPLDENALLNPPQATGDVQNQLVDAPLDSVPDSELFFIDNTGESRSR